MYVGIALYGTEKTATINALSLGVSVFMLLGLTVTNCGYNRYLKDGDHEGDHEFIETSLDGLFNEVTLGKISSFRLYDERDGSTPWYASFGLSNADFGNFHHIDMQFPVADTEKIEVVIKKIASSISFDYGIFYWCDRASKAFYYASGDNLASVYPYENPSLFKKETPGRFNGVESYRHSKLRMVYPFNLVNRKHLDTLINGLTLEMWITQNKLGELKQISNDLWCWIVEDSCIEQANRMLGEANLLISWKRTVAKKNSRSLP